tara:strand:- start:483 stop:608 length:126 start_codon:yes stop_codon:yes gene_type:complete
MNNSINNEGCIQNPPGVLKIDVLVNGVNITNNLKRLSLRIK